MEIEIGDNMFDVKPLLTSKDIQNGMMFKIFPREMSEESKLAREKQKQQEQNANQNQEAAQ